MDPDPVPRPTGANARPHAQAYVPRVRRVQPGGVGVVQAVCERAASGRSYTGHMMDLRDDVMGAWPGDGPVGADDEALRYGLRLIGEALEELGYEDAKAARLLAALSVAASAIVTGFFAGDWAPTAMTVLGQTIWYLGAAGVVAAICLVGAAVVTRGGRRPRAGEPSRLAFYGHAARHPDIEALTSTLRTVEPGPGQLSRVAERLWHVSRILVRKKRLLRAGLAVAAVGLVLCILAAPLNVAARRVAQATTSTPPGAGVIEPEPGLVPAPEGDVPAPAADFAD